MPRTARVVAFSTTPEMASDIDHLAAREGRTRSELLREAVRAYQSKAECASLQAAEPTGVYAIAPPPAASLPGLARVLSVRQDIARACAEAGVARLWAFGSAVRDDFDATRSDFDFLVEFLPDAPRKPWLGEIIDLREVLSGLLEGPEDDGEREALRNPHVRATAEAEKVLVYEHA